MTAHRIGYSLAAVLTWFAWLLIPIRALVFDSFSAGDRGDGKRTFSWIMLVFLGLLAVVFTMRAVRGKTPT